jgi:hypothetical protein
MQDRALQRSTSPTTSWPGLSRPSTPTRRGFLGRLARCRSSGDLYRAEIRRSRALSSNSSAALRGCPRIEVRGPAMTAVGPFEEKAPRGRGAAIALKTPLSTWMISSAGAARGNQLVANRGQYSTRRPLRSSARLASLRQRDEHSSNLSKSSIGRRAVFSNRTHAGSVRIYPNKIWWMGVTRSGCDEKSLDGFCASQYIRVNRGRGGARSL